jgi:hypothetical protein
MEFSGMAKLAGRETASLYTPIAVDQARARSERVHLTSTVWAAQV